jgi:hypothetical protein
VSKRVIVAALAAAALAGLPAFLAAQEEGYPFRWSNFRIEASGTWVGISPESLNRAVDYENAYLAHYYLDQYAYYDELFGDAYAAQFAYGGGSSFSGLDRVAPLSIALRYQASPTFGLSFGVERIRGARTSGVDLDVLIQDDRADASLPGASTARYENGDLTVSVESWMPYLAANFGWDLLKRLRTEIFIKGGPIFGDLRVWNQRLESVTTAEGTVSSGRRTMEMTGTSTSLAIEAGLQLRVRILSFAEIFGQAGYAFRQLNQISGLDTVTTVTTLPSASESSSSVRGTWGVTWEKATSPWGSFSAPTLTTSYNTMGRSTVGTTTASVDLSGLQIGAGLSIRL